MHVENINKRHLQELLLNCINSAQEYVIATTEMEKLLKVLFDLYDIILYVSFK